MTPVDTRFSARPPHATSCTSTLFLHCGLFFFFVFFFFFFFLERGSFSFSIFVALGLIAPLKHPQPLFLLRLSRIAFSDNFFIDPSFFPPPPSIPPRNIVPFVRGPFFSYIWLRGAAWILIPDPPLSPWAPPPFPFITVQFPSFAWDVLPFLRTFLLRTFVGPPFSLQREYYAHVSAPTSCVSAPVSRWLFFSCFFWNPPDTYKKSGAV